MTKSLRMQLNAGFIQVTVVCDPFECKGEGEAIGEEGGVTKQLDEGLEGSKRGGRVRK